MANIGDGLKNIFVAGVGALAYTGEKGKELIDTLIEKGEITLEQGRELNEELQRKASETTAGLRESALEASMKAMSPEERTEFARKAAEYAAKHNAADAEEAVETIDVETVEEEPAEGEAAAEEATEEAAAEEAPAEEAAE